MFFINLFAFFCIIFPRINSIADCNICDCTLEQIYCDSSVVTEIPLDWPNFVTQGVTQISILNTNIRVLKTNNFINFPCLVWLVIQNSQLKEIEDGAFNGVASRLTNLNFTNNKLNMINPRWFSGMTSLKELVLTSNNIEFVPSNSFADSTELEKLYLNNNQIKRVSIGNAATFNSTVLTDVKIGSNEFVCDCYLIWLQQQLIHTPSKFTDSEEALCTYPTNVTGKIITQVSLFSNFCLSLCLGVECTENSSCAAYNSFPACVCNSGFDPIGIGTYECTPASVASSTALPSTILTTDTDTHGTSTITNTLGPIISTSIIPSTLVTSSSYNPSTPTSVYTSTTQIPGSSQTQYSSTPTSVYSTTQIPGSSQTQYSSTPTSVHTSTTQIPGSSQTQYSSTPTSVYSTTQIPGSSQTQYSSTPTSVYSTTQIPGSSQTQYSSTPTSQTTKLSLSTIASSYSSHSVTPSLTPNNTNSFQANLLIPISSVVFVLIVIFVFGFAAIAIVLRLKKRKKVEKEGVTIENIQMEELKETVAVAQTGVNENPVFGADNEEIPDTQLEGISST